jgi:hypothetical protein
MYAKIKNILQQSPLLLNALEINPSFALYHLTSKALPGGMRWDLDSISLAKAMTTLAFLV